MTLLWVNRESLAFGGSFEALHAGLTVAMIQTPRAGLATCLASETAEAVNARNIERYDFLPVVEGETIVGLFHAAASRDNAAAGMQIGDHAFPLSEDHVIGSDASILDFVVEADAKPCRLVFSGPRITGLVSLSDLQKLPVRAALFALITGFEITMIEAIRRSHPNEADWLAQLRTTRRNKVNDEIERSRRGDGHVDSLLFTQFCDKREIIVKSRFPGIEKQKLGGRFKRIEDLRNRLAHANDYAATPDQARQVCATIRGLLELQKIIAGGAE